jgi:MFS family permease
MNAVSPLRTRLIVTYSLIFPGLGFAMLGTGFGFWAAAWKASYHLAEGEVMVAYTVGSVVSFLVSPLVGRVLDRVSVHAVVAAGAVLMAVTLALLAASNAFWQVVALFATLMPASAQLVGMLPAQTLLVRMFPRHTGLVSGVVSMSIALGGIVAAVAAPPLIAHLGWRDCFLVIGAVMVLVIAPMAWGLLNVPLGAAAQRLKREGADVRGDGKPRPPESPLRSPTFWVGVVATLSIQLPLISLAPHLVEVAVDAGRGASGGTALIAALALMASAGNLGGGWLVDRLNQRLVYFVLNALILGAMVLFASRPPFPVLVVASAMMGAAGGVIMPWTATLVTRHFGTVFFARIFGLLTMFLVPSTLFAVLVGWVRDRTGDYQVAFWFFFVLALPGLISVARLKSRPPAVLAAG